MNQSRSSDASPRTTDSTSLTLLDRAKKHDSVAWQRLVELYGPLVFSWCQRAGLAAEDRQDVVQEIFAAVAANLERFRREQPGDTFRGWVRVIARNQIRLFFRRQAKHLKTVGGVTAQVRMEDKAEGSVSDLDNAADDETERNRLVRCGVKLIRDEFEDRTWQAFWMIAVEQRPSAEVCQQLQMKPDAVRQAKYRVLRRLRTELGELLE
jgi:RNA polymerase sigma-70 factor (ECF subfamily)